MFLYKSDTCGLIIDVKWPLGALDKSLGENMQCYGFSALWLQALSPGPSCAHFCAPPSSTGTALNPSGVCLLKSKPIK